MYLKIQGRFKWFYTLAIFIVLVGVMSLWNTYSKYAFIVTREYKIYSERDQLEGYHKIETLLREEEIFKATELTIQHKFWSITKGTDVPSTEGIPFDQGSVSCENGTYVVAIILSHPSCDEMRQAIRDTWANQSNNQARKMHTVFITGLSLSSAENERVLIEMKNKTDLLRGDFVYKEDISTLPMIHGLNWVFTMCKSYRYVYVGHDYTMLNYKQLLRRLDYCENNAILSAKGSVGSVLPKPFSKFSKFVHKNYHLFCTDSNGFIITKPAVEEFVEKFPNGSTSLVPAELLGRFARERKWTIVNDNLFTSQRDPRMDACRFQDFVTVRGPEEPEELLSVWKNLHDINKLLNCLNPDLDIVLPTVDNRVFLEEVLAYKHHHPRACYDELDKPVKLFLIALIDSQPKDGGVRQSIRNTWCKELVVQGEAIRCVFVLGTPALEYTALKNKLDLEEKTYGDIIQANFMESYQNLTLKIIFGLKWMTEHFQSAKYFFKGDSDVFVNFNNIVEYIKKHQRVAKANNLFYLGNKMVGSTHFSPTNAEHRFYSRYFVSDNLFKGRYYPPYCSGGGYVMSMDVVPGLFSAALSTSIINIEDAFMGLLAKKVGLYATHHPGFMNYGIFENRLDTCILKDPSTMVVHHGIDSPGIIHKIWEKFSNNSKQCTNKIHRNVNRGGQVLDFPPDLPARIEIK